MEKKEQPRIGLALGAGAARGLAHIAVLEVLEQKGIKIDMIAGSSVGSLVGGVYAAGVPVNYMIELAREINWDYITDVAFPRQGLIKGDKLLAFLEVITGKKDISDLKIPYAAIACDIELGEHIVIKEGSLAKAIRASSSIPGVYVPYQHQDRLLVDGGVLDSVPVSTVREMGADIVIAVDLSKTQKLQRRVINIFDVLFNTFDIIQQELDKYKKLDADVIIRPDLSDCEAFNLDQCDRCFNAVYKEMGEATRRIKELIKESV